MLWEVLSAAGTETLALTEEGWFQKGLWPSLSGPELKPLEDLRPEDVCSQTLLIQSVWAWEYPMVNSINCTNPGVQSLYILYPRWLKDVTAAKEISTKLWIKLLNIVVYQFLFLILKEMHLTLLIIWCRLKGKNANFINLKHGQKKTTMVQGWMLWFLTLAHSLSQ